MSSPSGLSDAQNYVSRETCEILQRFVDLVLSENAKQNLIGRSTVPELWHRHIIDSLQLLPLAGEPKLWLDIGSGAGLPGLVVAISRPQMRMTLVEPRARRAAFLRDTAATLGLANVAVIAGRIEMVQPLDACVISARAVATLTDLFALATAHAAPGAVWLLPKGRRAAEELAEAKRTWQGRFELIPSVTDPEASIIMAHDVRPRHRP